MSGDKHYHSFVPAQGGARFGKEANQVIIELVNEGELDIRVRDSAYGSLLIGLINRGEKDVFLSLANVEKIFYKKRII